MTQHTTSNPSSPFFGFDLEFPAPQDPNAPKFAEESVRLVLELIQSTKEDDDDSLTITAASIHPRAAKKVAQLLHHCRKNKARPTLSFDGATVRFETDEQVAHAAWRLDQILNQNTAAAR